MTTPTVRMLPAVDVARQTLSINGRSYSGVPGSALDVMYTDAETLSANGWTWVAPSGPTAMRPSSSLQAPFPARRQALFYDTTIDDLIVYDGSTWRDASGAAV